MAPLEDSRACDGSPGVADDNRQQYFPLIRKSGIYAGSDLLRAAASFLLLPVYTAYLGPAEYGIVSIAVSVAAAIEVVSSLGMRGAVGRLYFDHARDRDRLRAFLGTQAVFLAGAGGFFLVALLTVGPVIWPLSGLTSVRFTPHITLTLIAVFLNSLGYALLHPLLFAQGRAAMYAVWNLASFAALTLLTLGLVVMAEQGALGALWARTLAAAIMLGPTLWLLRREARLTLRWDLLRPALVYGIPLIPHLLAMWALNFSDRPIVGSMVSVTEAGVYAVGYQFGMVVAILIAGINNAWSPWFFETSAAGRSDRIPAMTSVFVMLTAAITLGLVLFSRPSIRLLTASPYHEAWKVVPLVAVGYFVNGLTLRVLDVILLHKRTRVVPLTTLTAVAVNIGFNLVAIPRMGMLAAAYGTVLGYGVRLVLTGFFAIRMGTLPVEWRRTAWVCGLFAVLAGGGLCLAMDPAWLDLALRLGLWMLFPVGLVVTGTVRWSELRGFLEGVMGQGGNPGRSKRD